MLYNIAKVVVFIRCPVKNNLCILPYIKGTTEPNKRILRNYDIKVALKPYQTIGSLSVPKPKDPVPKDQTRGAIYSIPCQDCGKSYTGETKRKFASRLKEPFPFCSRASTFVIDVSFIFQMRFMQGTEMSFKTNMIESLSSAWRKSTVLRFVECFQSFTIVKKSKLFQNFKVKENEATREILS